MYYNNTYNILINSLCLIIHTTYIFTKPYTLFVHLFIHSINDPQSRIVRLCLYWKLQAQKSWSWSCHSNLQIHTFKRLITPVFSRRLLTSSKRAGWRVFIKPLQTAPLKQKSSHHMHPLTCSWLIKHVNFLRVQHSVVTILTMLFYDKNGFCVLRMINESSNDLLWKRWAIMKASGKIPCEEKTTSGVH